MASVRGQYLGGQMVLLENCVTVSDIMMRIARERQRFASDVVVFPVGSGEVLKPDNAPPPDVAIVLKREEPRLEEEEWKYNVMLHAEVEDTCTVVRALSMLQDVAPETQWPEDTLLDAARDDVNDKIVRTLIRAGINGGDALVCASSSGDTGAVQRLVAARETVDHPDTTAPSALTCASLNGHTEVVNILLAARAKMRSSSAEINKALSLSLIFGHKEVADVLIDAGAVLQ